jgi:Putative peptidoglycan binding domain
MRWLSIIAFVFFVCTAGPAAASTSRTHKTHPEQKVKTAGHTGATHARRAAAHPKSKERPRHAAERQASFRTVSQSSKRSPSHSSSKAKTKRSRRRHKIVRRRRTQMAPTPERISEIQSALTRTGYYKGDASGKWDADTVDALEKFQSANGLDPTGKLDALSLQKLGLGSDVAGVSAPRGIVEHSCCSIIPSSSMAPPPLAPTTPTSGADTGAISKAAGEGAHSPMNGATEAATAEKVDKPFGPTAAGPGRGSSSATPPATAGASSNSSGLTTPPASSSGSNSNSNSNSQNSHR